jgi:hypothetical protein
MSMPNKGYRFAVQWIALNDSPGDSDALDAEAVSGLVTAKLVADMFGKPDIEVGKAIVRARKRVERGDSGFRKSR